MTAEHFIETARRYLGYRTSPGGRDDFSTKTGYNGTGVPWSGSFIDCVSREAGLNIPACVYSPNAIAEFAADGRLKFKPRRGDIVFFSFSMTGSFGMTHVGIVTDVSSWKSDGTFTSIEAGISSGLPKAPKENDGVFERTRWKYEVIGFGRPNFKARPGRPVKNTDGQPFVLESQVRPGKKHASIEHVQRALIINYDLKNHEFCRFDDRTRQAYARFQRRIGLVGSDADGIPNESTLARLGRDTGVFSLKMQN